MILDARGPLVEIPEPEPETLLAADSPPAFPVASHPHHSIRLIERPGRLCALCAEETGWGPVGHSGDQAVCDRCFLGECRELGMVLALVAVTRAFAVVDPAEREESGEALAELGAFGRIFERVASKCWPRRMIRLPQDDETPS